MVAEVQLHGPTKVTVWASLSCSALIGLADLAVAVHLQKYWLKPQLKLFATVCRIDNGRYQSRVLNSPLWSAVLLRSTRRETIQDVPTS